jgi:glyoxylase-like metal-dependent hydrolase (beta-lactamase superfamily II)
VGPFQVNCYLLWNEETSEGVVIDPGAEAETIKSEMDQFNMTPKAVLLTHGHGDHIAALADICEEFKTPVYIGAGEEELLTDPHANISAFFDHPIVAPKPDHLVKDGDVIKIAGIRLQVLETPGHTKAGVCYLEEEAGRLFSGDTLFAGGIGRIDLPGGDFKKLLDSIRSQILTLPDSVVVYPGHGPRTTVGTERTSNPWLVGGQFA